MLAVVAAASAESTPLTVTVAPPEVPMLRAAPLETFPPAATLSVLPPRMAVVGRGWKASRPRR